MTDITSTHPWRALSSVLKSNPARSSWSSSPCNIHSFCPILISSFFWTFDKLPMYYPLNQYFGFGDFLFFGVLFGFLFCSVLILRQGLTVKPSPCLNSCHPPVASQGVGLVSSKQCITIYRFPYSILVFYWILFTKKEALLYFHKLFIIGITHGFFIFLFPLVLPIILFSKYITYFGPARFASFPFLVFLIVLHSFMCLLF